MQVVTWFGKIDYEADVEGGPFPQPNMRALAKTSGIALTDKEYNSRLRDAALSMVRGQLLELTTAEEDLLQEIEALDDLFSAINLLDERLYEWSRLHRQEIVHGTDLAMTLCTDETMGTLAKTSLYLREAAGKMEHEVCSYVEILAPNLSCMAGPVLAARLISRAGSLHNLAKMPSSRVQVMGAEKSLFKHLNGHAPSPKHGIIFRHPAVIGSPKRLRGKVARMLAGRLTVAARLDYFGTKLFPDIKSDMERRLTNIRQKGRNSPHKKR